MSIRYPVSVTSSKISPIRALFPIRQSGIPPQNRPIWCVWKIRSIITLFAKIRQICPSSKACQRHLNRGCFCHLFYPIRVPESLSECEYEGRFSGVRVFLGKWGMRRTVFFDAGSKKQGDMTTVWKYRESREAPVRLKRDYHLFLLGLHRTTGLSRNVRSEK
jgi:hypothetical protein